MYMNIIYVTFTGADDNTSIAEMQDISKKYPNVEWGILLSNSGMGIKPRFPSRARLDALAQAAGLQLSGHLCGAWMRKLVSSGYIDTSVIGPIWAKLARVQLNFSGSESLAKEDFLLDGSKNFILQSGGKPLPKNFNGGRYHVLFDGSGGRGKLAQAWPAAIPGRFCGYAGGLNPENIKDQLQQIAKAANQADFWIDFESGVRTDDKFDLSKVRCILKAIYG